MGPSCRPGLAQPGACLSLAALPLALFVLRRPGIVAGPTENPAGCCCSSAQSTRGRHVRWHPQPSRVGRLRLLRVLAAAAQGAALRGKGPCQEPSERSGCGACPLGSAPCDKGSRLWARGFGGVISWAPAEVRTCFGKAEELPTSKVELPRNVPPSGDKAEADADPVHCKPC